MGNDPIYCFNNTPEKESECIYKKCGMFSEELDLCKLEYLKAHPKKATKTPVGKQPQRVPELGDKINIRDLQPDMKSTKTTPINIEGEVLYNPEVKNTPSGKLISNLVIKDDTGQIRLTFWDDDTKTAMQYRAGDKVRIENLWRIDAPYEGNAQATPGKWAKFIKL